MILIDSREQWKEEIEHKLQTLDVTTQILKLDHYVDYMLTSDVVTVENVMVVQRKTINEVYSQFADIRERINELKEYGTAWLLVEEEGMSITKDGNLLSRRGKTYTETGIRANMYYNFLHSVQRAGVNVKTTQNWEQSVWWLYSLHSYIQKEHHPKTGQKYTTKEEIVGALVAIPKVGDVKANRIYDTYAKLYEKVQTQPQAQQKMSSEETNDHKNVVSEGAIVACDEDDEKWLREIEEDLEDLESWY